MFKSEFKYEPHLDQVKTRYIDLQFHSLDLVRTCLKSNEVEALNQSAQLERDTVPSAMLSKLRSTL